MHTSRRSVLLTTLAGILLVVPGAADAQIGGFIRKKVENKIADKVLGEQSSERRAPAPKFDDVVVEITDPRIDQLLRGLAGEERAFASASAAAAQAKQQGAARRSSYEAEMKAYEAAEREYARKAREVSQCQMAVIGRAGGAAMANPAALRMAEAMAKLPEAERDAFEARVEARQEKMQAAEDRGDRATAAKLAAEMDADMKKTLGVSAAELQQGGAASASLAAEQQKCGEVPQPPVRPEDPDETTVSVRDSVQRAAYAESGMEGQQYSVMRERVSAWFAAKEKKRGSLGAYGFTDAELAVLERRHADLKAREAVLLAEDSQRSWSF